MVSVFLDNVIKILILSLFISFFNKSQAQDGNFVERMVESEKKAVLDSIPDLSEDQKIIIESIYEDYEKAIRNNFTDHAGDREAMRSGMAAIIQEKNQAMEALLTEEQFKKYSSMLESRRQGFRRRN